MFFSSSDINIAGTEKHHFMQFLISVCSLFILYNKHAALYLIFKVSEYLINTDSVCVCVHVCTHVCVCVCVVVVGGDGVGVGVVIFRETGDT